MQRKRKEGCNEEVVDVEDKVRFGQIIVCISEEELQYLE